MSFFDEIRPSVERKLKQAKIQRICGLSEDIIRSIVTAGGGAYIGIQEGYKHISPQVLFSEPASSSTLSVNVEDLSISSVRNHINKHYETNEEDLKTLVKQRKHREVK
jgi:hypothetical protein